MLSSRSLRRTPHKFRCSVPFHPEMFSTFWKPLDTPSQTGAMSSATGATAKPTDVWMIVPVGSKNPLDLMEELDRCVRALLPKSPAGDSPNLLKIMQRSQADTGMRKTLKFESTGCKYWRNSEECLRLYVLRCTLRCQTFRSYVYVWTWCAETESHTAM